MPFNPMHYVDPVMNVATNRGDADQPPRPIMITATKRGYELPSYADNRIGVIDKISENHRDKFTVSSGVAWAVDSGGNHVAGVLGYGPDVSRSYAMENVYGSYIFPLDGGAWGYGSGFYRPMGSTKPFGEVTGDGNFTASASGFPEGRSWGVTVEMRSDGKPVSPRTYAYPPYVFPINNDAYPFFPKAGMNQEQIDILGEAAKSVFEMRRAEFGVQVQAHRRGWGDDPRNKLIAHGVTLPEPRLGLRVTGTMQVIQDLSQAQKDALEAAGLDANRTNITLPENFEHTFMSVSDANRDRLIDDRIMHSSRAGVSGYKILSTEKFIGSLS